MTEYHWPKKIECDKPNWICHDYWCVRCGKIYCGAHYNCGCWDKEAKELYNSLNNTNIKI